MKRHIGDSIAAISTASNQACPVVGFLRFISLPPTPFPMPPLRIAALVDRWCRGGGWYFHGDSSTQRRVVIPELKYMKIGASGGNTPPLSPPNEN